MALAKRLGVPSALGLSVEQWVNDRLGGYVKMSVTERRGAVKNLTDDGLSTREVAEILGVSHMTTHNDVKNFTPIDAVATLAADEEDTSDGAENSARNGEKTGKNEEDTSDGAENSAPPDAAPTPLGARALLSQSDQNDWRTPRKYLDAARAVMGEIDLDPASSAEANETVRAIQFYTENENGLGQPWKGRVWLNPPFGDAGGGIRLSDSAAAAIGRLVVDMIARRRSPASVAPERTAPVGTDDLRRRYSARN